MSARKEKENPFAANIAATTENMARLFGGATPATVLEVAAEPTPEVAPKPRASKSRPRAEAVPVPQPQSQGKWPVASWRVRPEQVGQVRTAAVRRANARGYGKADQSEIVREALDMWMEAHPEEWEE